MVNDSTMVNVHNPLPDPGMSILRRRTSCAVTLMFGAALLLGGMGSGCSGGDVGSPHAGADAGPDATPLPYGVDRFEVSWSTCSLHDGADDGLAECASTSLPVDWEDPEGPTRVVRAKRLLSGQGGRRQYWLLAGGPGRSGMITMPPLMQALQRQDPALDVYTLDQRGSGYSDYLACPEQQATDSDGGAGITEAEIAPCIAYLQATYGDLLPSASTTQVAIDLAAYIEGSRVAGVPVFVRGLSYGTYLALRYLQIFPSQADGVVLEGLVPPDFNFALMDERGNEVGRDLMDLCAQDTFCVSMLGSDPMAFLGDALASHAMGGCPDLAYETTVIKRTLSSLMYDHWLNSAIPAVAYRLHRCAPEDVDALNHLILQTLGTPDHENRQYSSNIKFLHNAISELWAHPAHVTGDLGAYFDELEATSLFVPFVGQLILPFVATWPAYDEGEYGGSWPSTDLPILMMNGRLDHVTPHEHSLAVAEHFSGPNQYWVSFPQGSHHLATGTPLPSDPESDHCAVQLQVAFLQDPARRPDTSCVDQVLPIHFAGSAALANELFGTQDFFALAAASPPAPYRLTAVYASIRRALQRARHRAAIWGGVSNPARRERR